MFARFCSIHFWPPTLAPSFNVCLIFTSLQFISHSSVGLLTGLLLWELFLLTVTVLCHFLTVISTLSNPICDNTIRPLLDTSSPQNYFVWIGRSSAVAQGRDRSHHRGQQTFHCCQRSVNWGEPIYKLMQMANDVSSSKPVAPSSLSAGTAAQASQGSLIFVFQRL